MFLNNRRNCKCECQDYNEGLWDICNCNCDCKGHRENSIPSTQEIQNKNKYIQKAIERKKKLTENKILGNDWEW